VDPDPAETVKADPDLGSSKAGQITFALIAMVQVKSV
jgi:hypothetical protein